MEFLRRELGGDESADDQAARLNEEALGCAE